MEASLQPCLVLHFSQEFVAGCCLFGADGPCFELAKLCCYFAGPVISQGVLPGVIQLRIVLQLCLPSLPHPAWPAEQLRDSTACLITCLKHLKLLR